MPDGEAHLTTFGTQVMALMVRLTKLAFGSSSEGPDAEAHSTTFGSPSDGLDGEVQQTSI